MLLSTFFGGRLGFELQALLAKQALYFLSQDSSQFCSDYFGVGFM
jgi:hypothetical protein